MTIALPRTLDRRIAKALAELPGKWEIVQRRDHYFLHVDGHAPICLASNSPRKTRAFTSLTLNKIRRLQCP